MGNATEQTHSIWQNKYLSVKPVPHIDMIWQASFAQRVNGEIGTCEGVGGRGSWHWLVGFLFHINETDVDSVLVD